MLFVACMSFTASRLRTAAPFVARGAASRAGSAACMLATPGSFVQLRYSLKDEETGEPLPAAVGTFDQGTVKLVVGGGGLLAGVHSKVQQISEVGVPTTFVLQPAEAFGDSNPNLGPVEVPASAAPDGLAVGDKVRLSNGLKATVTEVDASSITIDANHPFAGRALSMEAELLSPPADAGEVLEKATFAGGCFWGLELAFQRAPGVVATEVGYTQGVALNPTYEQVCSGSTGHTEAVRATFDPSETSFAALCDLFWERLGDNRYLLNQVGNDRGTQYRHGIYPENEEQEAVAAESFAAAAAAGPPGKEIATEQVKAREWYSAEEYHQQYLQKGGQSAKKEAQETIRCYG